LKGQNFPSFQVPQAVEDLFLEGLLPLAWVLPLLTKARAQTSWSSFSKKVTGQPAC
jgi:hypothetical protein